jgi:predicted dehydrogenase
MTQSLAVGVVGLGFGANHARVLSSLPGARLAAVCDTNPDRLAASIYGAAQYADLATMLRQEKLDALVVAVPAHLHAAVALAAIEAGCAVLVEKPLATSYEEGARLVSAAVAAGVPLMAGHIERFNPALQEMARRVRAGEIGRVLQLTARRMSTMRMGLEGRRLPPQDVNVVHDSAIHDIDAVLFLVDAPVEEVYASAQSGIVTPNEDGVSGQIRFASRGGRPGALATLEVNWLSPRRVRDLTVTGERGTFVLDYAAQSLELHKLRAGSAESPATPAEAISIPVERGDQLVLELAAFVGALRSGSAMPVSGEDALAALAIADALTLSARSGRPVTPVRPEA